MKPALPRLRRQRPASAGVKLAEAVIKEAGIKLEEDKASEGAGGGGKLKIVPYTVRQLSFGAIQGHGTQSESVW